MTADIIAAYIGNNSTGAAAIPGLIIEVVNSLSTLSGSNSRVSDGKVVALVPVVPIKKSATPDFLICLEDGHKFKTLKQHLMGHCGLTPKEYRAKWGLPSDYPMVAQNYALSRSKLAKSIGLGKKLRSLETSDAPVPGSKRKKLGLKFSD